MVDFSVEAKVRGGFPVLVTGYIHEAEPNVGYTTTWYEIDEVLTTKGRPASFLKLSKKELDDLECDVADIVFRKLVH